VTCNGPNIFTYTGSITVCNPGCNNILVDDTGVVSCKPGYAPDAENSAACNYAPISGPDIAGCPIGYKLIDRGSAKTCALLPDQNGLCPSGLYYDSSYGACVSVSGIVEAPYGLNNPGLATQVYAGCPQGYAYDSNFQCCQAVIGGTYPTCAPGSTFDASLGACAPGDVRLSGPGCVTVDLTTIKCSEREDFCSKILAEGPCLQASYACAWDDQKNVCYLKSTK
jgi:hypothetical protein